jgi:hypothetical protein
MPPAGTGTYTQLTRDEFEEWLTRDLGFSPSEWRLKPGRGGVYQLFLSPTVAIEVNSTTGTQDAVMGRGNASMSLWLASRINGKVLNKKAMGQAHFARTKNWRDNWKKGVERMKDAYIKLKDFYDRLASIEDLDQYKQDTLALIESNAGWQGNTFLSDMHEKVQRGSILSEKQQAALTPRRAPAPAPVAPAPRAPAPAAPVPAQEDPRLRGLRELWGRAQHERDGWTADFVQSIAQQIKAGRRLSPRQEEILDDKARYYGVRVASRRVRATRGRTASQRVAMKYAMMREAGLQEWLGWMAQPLHRLLEEHRELVYGPVDDLMDEVFRKLAPALVKKVGEQEVDADVTEFLLGAQMGREHAKGTGVPKSPPSTLSEDGLEGYRWGRDHASVWDGKELPPAVRARVVAQNVAEFQKQVTEKVVIDLLKKAWKAISPVTTVKAIVQAVKKHGWKLGVGFVLFEIAEHALLPALLAHLTGKPEMMALASLPIGEIIYAVVFRVLGKAPKELNAPDEEGHLDWYEANYGPVRLAHLRRKVIAARTMAV